VALRGLWARPGQSKDREHGILPVFINVLDENVFQNIQIFCQRP
jgi:hypothetical protein